MVIGACGQSHSINMKAAGCFRACDGCHSIVYPLFSPKVERMRISVKLLPMYAASLCSKEWLETVESYQDDPETLRFVLGDFCRKHRHLLCDCGACDSCSEEQIGRPHTCFLWMSYP